MYNELRKLVRAKSEGSAFGITSFCTANRMVLEACFENGLDNNAPILIEATANQVNQFGGYTGMTPEAFRDYVYAIAASVGFPRNRIILGGDHLGPLVWKNESENTAMEKAAELVHQYIAAGYTKIHLDTSMRLASDPKDVQLSNETIARRGAFLYKICDETFSEMTKAGQSYERPVFIIGSEVPVPGGGMGQDEALQVTCPDALTNTLEAYRESFRQVGKQDAFADIIGVVVQPGVEFDNSNIHNYDREKAKALIQTAKTQNNIILEGHSTDYQPAQALKELVEDGVAILKVGPALTFALREGLFALSAIEKELVKETDRADFIESLEGVMLANPVYWEEYYKGSEDYQRLNRKYSYSDRCRYYLDNETLAHSVRRLINNLDRTEIPMSLLHQFLPIQYNLIRNGKLSMNAAALIKSCVKQRIGDYDYATIKQG